MKQFDLRIGSFCTGYGGLDLGVMAVLGGRLVWCADSDRHVATILASRYPGVPNLGDITGLSWRRVSAVNIITAGFPCQDISYSGRGAGIEKGARSGIWRNIVRGIRVLRPEVIVVENVVGLRSRGLDRVLGDLAKIGYDAVWTSLRASDVGAAHKRERVFILAYRTQARRLLAAADAVCDREPGRSARGYTHRAGAPGTPGRPSGVPVYWPALDESTGEEGFAWGPYEPAVRYWEAQTGRLAPYPIEFGTKGQPRLSPVFTEWLMGLPRGFVTDLPLPYGAKHRAIGNGVVPHQAIAALRELVHVATQVSGDAVAMTEGSHGSW